MDACEMNDQFPDDPRLAVEELMSRAYDFDYGTTRIALVEEAVRMADLSGDLDLAFDVRQSLIDASTMGGRPDLALVAFTWCLAHYDKRPQDYDTHDMLWKYKWILASLAEFPQLTRAQIDEAADDMERRSVGEGYNRHAVETMRWKLAMDMGEHEEMLRLYDRLRKIRRDGLSDCKACVQNCTVEHYILLGKPKLALRAAEPLITGRMGCSEIPEITYGTILQPLFQLDRLEEAMDTHLKGYRLVARNPEFIDTVAEHLRFLVMTGNNARALQLIAKHLPIALANPSLLKRLRFYFASLLAFAALEANGKESVKLRLPPGLPFSHPEGIYPVVELRRKFETIARNLATEFDTRNGNAYYLNLLGTLHDSLQHIKPFAVPTRRKRREHEDDKS